VKIYLGAAAIALNSVVTIVTDCLFQASPTRLVPAAIILFS
jgi:hypothetical protein